MGGRGGAAHVSGVAADRRAGRGPAPFVIGVTGNTASGKSTVLAVLRDLGATTIDADVVYHALIRSGEPLWRALRDRFGDGIVGADGAIDRKALGAVVFANPAALAGLDALTHPAVVAEVRRRIAASTGPVVAVDAVKLIESGLDRDCDAVWLVTASRETQTERLMARNGLSRTKAERRVDAQAPSAAKAARADLVIDNAGSVAELRSQVVAGWRGLGFDGVHPAREAGTNEPTNEPDHSRRVASQRAKRAVRNPRQRPATPGAQDPGLRRQPG